MMKKNKNDKHYVWLLESKSEKKYIIYSAEKPTEYIENKIIFKAPHIYNEIKKSGMENFSIKILESKLNKEEAVKRVVYYNNKFNNADLTMQKNP